VSRLADILETYTGSDGERTKALYVELESSGPIGAVATNLFRACKASERAKVYRGGERGRGSYRRMAYDRKQWAMDNLCSALAKHATDLRIVWGWGRDNTQPRHCDVLYIELPTGQVSFHTACRGQGPDYHGAWDGQRGQSADRICRWVARLLAREAAA
jgi:hypothetical protein